MQVKRHFTLLLIVIFILSISVHLNAKSYSSIPKFRSWADTATISLSGTTSSVNLRAEADAGWDTDKLYLRIRVNDSTKQTSPNLARDFSNQDHVIISLDPSGTGASQGRTLPGKQDYIFIITPRNAFGDPLITSYAYGGHEHLSLDLRSISYYVAQGDNHYTVTLEIPWSLLGVDAKGNQQIGMAITVGDVTDSRLTTVSSLGFYAPADPNQWLHYSLD